MKHNDTANLGAYTLKYYANLIGVLQSDAEMWFRGEGDGNEKVDALVEARLAAKTAKNFAEADRIRKELADQGIILEDKPDGTTDWRRA